MEIRTDRKFEFEALKTSISKKTIFALSILYIAFATFGVSFISGLISKYGFSYYTIYWILYFAYFLFIYPAVILYFQTKPKTYKVTMTGLIVNGQKIRWKNFKRITIEDNRIVLEKRFGGRLILPIELKDDILKFAPCVGQNGTLSSQVSKEVRHHPT